MNARHVNFGSKDGMGAALYGAISLELTAENYCVVVRDSADHSYYLSPDDPVMFEGGKSWKEPAQEQETDRANPPDVAPTIVKTRRRRRKRNPETGELE